MSTDVSSALLAKSDQLNADDLLGGPMVIEITKVTNLGKGKEQPLIINYRGDDGKPWKPCKSMGRVMVQAWGTTDGSKWVGKLVKLFRDPNVTFGADKPGGIRISHLSNIPNAMELTITKTRGKKGGYKVEPLIVQNAPAESTHRLEIEQHKANGKQEAAKGMDALKAWWKSIGGVNQNLLGAAFLDEMKGIASSSVTIQAESPPMHIESEYIGDDIPPMEE